jgi:ABC-type Fe3+-hydroxamate transport system substrate-binding protein
MKLITRYVAVLVIAVCSFGTALAAPVTDMQVSAPVTLQECQGLDDETPTVPERIVVITEKDECIIVLSLAVDHIIRVSDMSDMIRFRQGLMGLYLRYIGEDIGNMDILHHDSVPTFFRDLEKVPPDLVVHSTGSWI